MKQLRAMPKVRDLQVLYVDRSSMPSLTTRLDYVQLGPTITSLTPAFAEAIRGNPNLRTIHILRFPLDTSALRHFYYCNYLELNHIGGAGYVSSMRHAGEELLCLELLMDSFELADDINPAPSQNMSSKVLASIEYTSVTNAPRQKIIARTPMPSWQTFTDYRSAIVPLSVVEAMWDVEGIERGHWKARSRIDVGAEAWSILTKWYEDYTNGSSD